MSSFATYTLRNADEHDLNFLFGVIAANKNKPFDWGEEFREFKKNFEPEKIRIIRYQNRDVGRLRVFWPPNCLWVGGIHLLPVYQSRGIGSAIFATLIKKSGQRGVPVRLWVYDENESAFRFYTRHGFVEEVMSKEERLAVKIPDGVKQLIRAPR
ncbi:MAG TPA: GNAT family N-acetyltransferase [Candidatus Paceibacterota bacterium]|nr:GNAT family N-acetyltransferase [Candidatus Paceibacterota bacterium]